MHLIPKYIILFFISFLLFISCSNEKSSWDKAAQKDNISEYRDYIKLYPDGKFVRNAQERITQIEFEICSRRNTVKAYNEFIENNPESSLVDKADEAIERIYDSRNSKFKEIRFATIKINALLPDGSDIKFFTRLDKRIKLLFDYAGISVVETNSEIPYAVNNIIDFEVYIKGTPVLKTYHIYKKTDILDTESYFSTEHLYTGSRISGYILCKNKGQEIFSRDFYHSISPPEEFSLAQGIEKAKEESNAPFDLAWRKIAFQNLLFDFFKENFGEATIIDALPDYRKELYWVTSFYDLGEYISKIQPPQRILQLFDYCTHLKECNFIAQGLEEFINEPWMLDPIIEYMKVNDTDKWIPAFDMVDKMDIVPERIIDTMIEISNNSHLTSWHRETAQKKLIEVRGYFTEEVETWTENLVKIKPTIDSLHQVLDRNPKDDKALLSLGNFYVLMKFKNNAINTYNKYLEIYPNQIDILVGLGILYAENNEQEKSIDSFNKALNISKDNQLNWFNYGLEYYNETSDSTSFVNVWGKILEIDTNGDWVNRNLLEKVIFIQNELIN